MRRSILALAILAFPLTAAAEVRTYRIETRLGNIEGCGTASSGAVVWTIQVDLACQGLNVENCPVTLSGSGPGGVDPFHLDGLATWSYGSFMEFYSANSNAVSSDGSYEAYLQFYQDTMSPPATIALALQSPWDDIGVEYHGADGCFYNTYGLISLTDITASASTDADGDGVPDTSDACPGYDDTADADHDGTADGCDACPADATGDSDGDGVCDSQDPCPADENDDSDGDSVCDSADTCAGGDDLYDSDGDSIPDDCDVCAADPANDADFDGVCGNDDACDGGDDGLDRDDDGTADFCDACPDDFYGDSDFDGLCDSEDPCPLDNPDDPDQDGVCTTDDVCRTGDDSADRDGDGTPDACDVCPDDAQNDVDGDGICGNLDNCAGVSNANQADTDLDGIGNACEPDVDNDGVIDDNDNCPMDANASQADADHDGIGDVCDADSDGDGVIGSTDQCPGTPLGSTVNGVGCTLDQLVPCAGNWKNHGAYSSAYAQAANAFKSAGLITEAQRASLSSAASQSSCGK